MKLSLVASLVAAAVFSLVSCATAPLSDSNADERSEKMIPPNPSHEPVNRYGGGM